MGSRKDIFPQYTTFTVTQTAADTTTTRQIQVPIIRAPSGKKISIIEIVRVEHEYTNFILNAAVENMRCNLSFRSFGTTDASLANPEVFFGHGLEMSLLTSGAAVTPLTYSKDVTTGGGKGLLVATESIFAQVNSVQTGAAIAVAFKLWYRIVDVNLVEYIGIVQQQQIAVSST